MEKKLEVAATFVPNKQITYLGRDQPVEELNYINKYLITIISLRTALCFRYLLYKTPKIGLPGASIISTAVYICQNSTCVDFPPLIRHMCGEITPI